MLPFIERLSSTIFVDMTEGKPAKGQDRKTGQGVF
jgi:hypothetical protein